jgi:hypothetical protein
MFENLKTGDTIKIGGKEFKVTGHLHIKNRNSELGLQNGIYIKSVPYHCLEFLGAEIVRKAPPKYTPVKSGLGSFALSSGKFDQFGHLLVLVDNYFENWPIWEVLEIEKC